MWTESESARFRDYHKRSNGALLLLLRSRMPVMVGKTIEEVALEAKFKEGFEVAIREIESILSSEQQQGDGSSNSFASM